MPRAPWACVAPFAAEAVRCLDDGAHLLGLYCLSAGLPPSESTPPVGMNLITSAPYLTFSSPWPGLPALRRPHHHPSSGIRAPAGSHRVSARDSDGWAGHHHSRARHVTGIDSVAQREVLITAGGNVAHRGEARLEGHTRVARARQRLAVRIHLARGRRQETVTWSDEWGNQSGREARSGRKIHNLNV